MFVVNSCEGTFDVCVVVELDVKGFGAEDIGSSPSNFSMEQVSGLGRLPKVLWFVLLGSPWLEAPACPGIAVAKLS